MMAKYGLVVSQSGQCTGYESANLDQVQARRQPITSTFSLGVSQSGQSTGSRQPIRARFGLLLLLLSRFSHVRLCATP